MHLRASSKHVHLAHPCTQDHVAESVQQPQALRRYMLKMPSLRNLHGSLWCEMKASQSLALISNYHAVQYWWLK